MVLFGQGQDFYHTFLQPLVVAKLRIALFVFLPEGDGTFRKALKN
jgi:hypothetical protein